MTLAPGAEAAAAVAAVAVVAAAIKRCNKNKRVIAGQLCRRFFVVSRWPKADGVKEQNVADQPS